VGLRAVRFPRECSPVRRPLQADEQTAREKGTFGYPIVEGSSSQTGRMFTNSSVFLNLGNLQRASDELQRIGSQEGNTGLGSEAGSSEITRQRCRFPVGCGNGQGYPNHYARRPKRGRTFSSLHPFAQIESYSCHACRSVPRAALPSCGTRGTAVPHFRTGRG